MDDTIRLILIPMAFLLICLVAALGQRAAERERGDELDRALRILLEQATGDDRR